MLGGGTFTAQNKILPGSYINFVSLSKANANLSDRGIVTMPLVLDWGAENEVVEVTNSDFQKNALKLFGYEYSHEKMKGLRDLFLNAQKLYAYRLNGSGEKATCTYATAKYAGIRGNDLKIIIQKNVDDSTKFDVKTVLGTTTVDEQTVKTAAELADNDYVTFKSDAELTVTAATSLTGGTNATVDGTSYQNYLDKIESYTYNVMGIATTEDAIKQLAVSFCKRMRDEVGAKFQVVLHNISADYEGVINVINNVTEDDNFDKSSIVYFITGIEANCAINKTCLNKVYNGEFEVDTNYTQSQLEDAIKEGKLVLHNVDSDVRILEDVNSLVTTSDIKGDVFKDNQTIRIVDQIANDIATLFNTKYLGNVPNDESGRISLWADIVKHHEQLQDIRAIEGFSDSDVTVEAGDTKTSVVINDNITIINAMSQLYMTVQIG
jgi:hypothetical protein